MSVVEVSCDTCIINGKCKEDDCQMWMDDYGEPNQQSFCKNRGLIYWSPRKELRVVVCFDCPMEMTNENGDIRCCRHSGPCFKNPNYSDMSKWKEFLVEYRSRRGN